MGDILEGHEEREERRAIPAVGVDVSYGSFRVSLKISDRETARSILTGVGIGCGAAAILIGAYYLRKPQLVMSALRGALETITGLQVDRVTPGSILVELLCNTKESFLLFMEDFETKKVERRLNEEFKNTGFNGELEVIIINKNEAYKHLEKIRGGVSSKRGYQHAIPLCLPNNCTWDSETGECVQSGEERRSLYVVEEAIEQLKKIKGPLCVVSIAGPCRKGKSYILSKAFDQGEVFPLGHELKPETMGIWMWIVPEIYQDSSGQEFTVVLLDSEGIDAVSGEGSDDHCIFTLTVLLASVLIYNSAGVPTRTDLNKLDYIVELSKRIQIHSGSQGGDAKRGSIDHAKVFHKTFPFFIWLLRDVVLALPKDCPNIKDYFLSDVFKTVDSSKPDKAKEVAESILSYFNGFDAFKLPLPSSDPEVVLNLNRDEVQQDINKSFVRGVEEFKANLKSKLVPKLSFNEGGIVTGEALATMVTSYVTELNTPGMVPNVERTWDVYVTETCRKATSESMAVYEETMASEMSGRMPCERDVIRQAQVVALDKALKLFEEKTYGITTRNIEQYLHLLTDDIENGLNNWQKENSRLTMESCHQLLLGLKHEHLDPVLTQLRGKDGAKVSFAEIMACYSAIEQGFKAEAKGAEDVRSQVFYEFHPELQAEMKNYVELLQQLKDFDENLAYEKQVRAQEMQEKKRLEEERARLVEERAMKEREFELLKVKQEEEKRRLEEKLRSDMESQKRQMENMMRANMKELQRERERDEKQNKTLQNAIDGIQKSLNERNNEITNLQRQIQEKDRLEEERARQKEEREIREKEEERARQKEEREIKEKEEERARQKEERAIKWVEQLQANHEDEKRRLEKQLQSEMEQRRQMEGKIKANEAKLNSGAAQNKTLQQSIAQMQRSLNDKNTKIEGIQRYIKKKEEDRWCVII